MNGPRYDSNDEADAYRAMDRSLDAEQSRADAAQERAEAWDAEAGRALDALGRPFTRDEWLAYHAEHPHPHYRPRVAEDHDADADGAW